ncbi:hypothetical protein PEL8287_01401 [Roseovarius litorisediminis]|uniref:Uncharacterized protein n=2 Tax=Roseovarius litorisediminis TaxID=1312363 RepID=A0A1Y5S1V6_9RHOB|nr:hypothetical protein PEL8287_01401 [Roseovarius litorisediminis]
MVPLQPPHDMALATLARNLPQTLAHSEWSEEGIRWALTRRLPAGIEKSITSLRAGERQQVTGIVVDRHLNVPRADYARLKAILHACAQPDDHRLHDPRFRAHLAGRIGWVAQLNPTRDLRLFALLEAAQ